MLDLKILACAFLMIFLNIASFDGLYLHLYKFKLHAREDSQREHLLHSINTLLFPWSIYFIFLDQFKGFYLWFGILLTALSFTIEFFDVFEEKRSREKIGGLANYEYAMHMAMGCLRGAYTSMILIARPASDWSLNSSSLKVHESNPYYMNYFVTGVLIIGLMISAVHFGLIFQQKVKRSLRHA